MCLGLLALLGAGKMYEVEYLVHAGLGAKCK